MKRALVLSGGGARGSYQFGVWKALRKLGINFDIVTGTSIGAVNGAIIAQNDFKLAEDVWYKINTKDVFYFDYDLYSKDGQTKFYFELAKAFVNNGGLDLTKMEEILKKYINEDKVRNSKTEFGLVTYSVTKNKAVVLKKSDIPKGKLVDYIIASATCFPVVRPKEIDNEKFLDGGYFDVMPINLAIDMGADEIIAVDLKAIGLKKRVDSKYVNTKIIAPSVEIGSFLSFTPNDAKFRIALGYNDTMKAYKKLDGRLYTFKKNNLMFNYYRYRRTYVRNFENIILTATNRLKKSFAYPVYNGIYRHLKDDKYMISLFSSNIDQLGRIYKMDITKIYTYNQFYNILFQKIADDKITRRNFDGQIINESLYYLIMNNNKLKIKTLALAFPKNFALALYLFVIYQNMIGYKKKKFKNILEKRVKHGRN